MNILLQIIGAIVLIRWVLEYTLESNAGQLNISLSGFNKIPKVLLELAQISKEDDISYDDLTKEEVRKFGEIHTKLSEAVFCTLTYTGSRNLIHIQKENKSYFHKVSNHDRYLIYEELGELNDKLGLYYVLYRKDNGWLRGAELIGYLLRKKTFSSESEVTHLFKFPESLIRRRFFTKSLQKKYNLEENTIAEYIDEDELGFSRGIYGVSYDKKDELGSNYWFRTY